MAEFVRIHVTRKLADKLKKAGHLIVDGPARQDSLLDGWHANLVVIQRRNCMLFIHDQTRYAVALIGMTQKDLKQIDRWFDDMLVNSMMKLGYPSELVERTTRYLTPLAFDTQCDRSVQGTLRVAVQDLESFTWDGSDIMALGPYSLSAKLSERPSRIKGMKETECLWPHKEMLKLLEQLPA
ncbi:DUF6933 domain-containing protein [Marinobacterium aestuariivivens]|uniref:DUF6933 domain-containing protein n=1 Tax=Marinobacterium aestuariivivens TaxID=1698799 RepID=A0ABW2A773_9GAMM